MSGTKVGRTGANRTKFCNSNYFKTWSNETAYWLGFLYADGSVHVSDRTSRVFFALKCIDNQSVVNLANALQSNYKISYFSNHHGFSKTSCMIRHQIPDRDMANDLIQLGCVPNKSKHGLIWPDSLPSEMSSHFIRGFFDGDGSLSFSSPKSAYYLDFYGPESFLSSIRSEIIHKASIEPRGSSTQKRQNCSRISFGGTLLPMAVLQWMYTNSTPATRLFRKYSLFRQLNAIKHLTPSDRLAAMQIYWDSDEFKSTKTCTNMDCPRKKKETLNGLLVRDKEGRACMD